MESSTLPACNLCGLQHTTAVCFAKSVFGPPSVACAPNPPYGNSMMVDNGVAKCGAGCASLPCSHWPNWIDLSSKLSQSDVERIARRVVELLAEELPKRLAPYLTQVSKED